MDLDFDERDADSDDEPLGSEPAPTMDGEPVSMRELEMIFAPGVVPPPMMGSTPQRRTPPPLPPARRPATGTPLPRPRDDRLSDLQTMAALNPRPERDSDPPPDSRARDLRSMSGPPPRRDADKRVDDEVLMLSGGLFDSPLAPLLSPDTALAPPPLSELGSSPPSEPPPSRSSKSRREGKKNSRKRSGKSSRPPPASPHKRTLAPTSVSSAGAKKNAHATTKVPLEDRARGHTRWVVPVIAAAALTGGFLVFREAPPSDERAADPSAERAEAAPPDSISDPAPPPAAPAVADEPAARGPEPADLDLDRPALAGPMPTIEAPGEAPPESASSVDPLPIQPPKEDPAPSLGPFDKSAASVAMSSAAASAGGCRSAGDPSGVAKVTVTFAPSGRATTANVSGPPFAGTATGGCIAKTFRQASIQPFDGAPVTVSKTVTIH
jgi:hypothetical protein